MVKPAIFMDFDGFKFDTIQDHVAYFNHRYGIQTTVSDYAENPSLDTVINKYLPAHKHVNRDEVYIDSIENFLSSIEWHKHTIPFEGMCDIIQKLARKYKLITVTAREKQARAVVQYFLDMHIPNCITDIHFVNDYAGNRVFNEKITKRDFIINYQGEKIAFLDDSAYEILELQDILPSYLFDQNGVHDDDKRIVHRVRSWEEIGKLFL